MNKELLQRYISGTCSAKEKQIVEDWLNESPKNKQTMEEIEQIWSVSPGSRMKIDPYQAWDSFTERYLETKGKQDNSESNATELGSNKDLYRERSLRTGNAKATMYSVAVAVILLVAFLFYSINSTPAEVSTPKLVSQEISTTKGQRSTVKLSDGTRVDINAESKLRIPGDYMDNEREVYLEGEAFFEVVPNKKRAFIVHTNKSVTRVLGTKFNVAAYPDEEKVQVVVAEGKVTLGANEELQGPEVQLTRDQKGTINPNGEVIASKLSEVASFLDWRKGKLTFRDAPLEEVKNRLERWYDVEVVIDHCISRESRLLTGSFKNVSLSSVLNSIALSLDISYQREGGEIVFEDK